MSRYLLLYAHDVPESVWLLRHEVPSDNTGERSVTKPFFIPRAFYVPSHGGKIEVRPQYEHLRCSTCKKLDERRALSLGLASDIRIRLKTDFFGANDQISIISTRLRDLFRDIPGSDISFFELPGAEQYCVAMPNIVYHAKPGDPAFRMARPCAQCGRWREVVWGTMPPPMDRECQVGMFQLENRTGMMPTWVVAESVAILLQKQKPKLKGLLFDEPFSLSSERRA